MNGILYLLPAPLQPYGETEWSPEVLLAQIPSTTLAILKRIDFFAVESTRTASRFLSRIKDRESMGKTVFLELNEHGGEESIARCLKLLSEGRDCGFLSDAGMPCIADPGAALVAAAHEAGARVMPVSGPSSLLLALSASGLDAQRFAFLGYLPQENASRRAVLSRLGAEFLKDGITRVFIETPYRNDALLAECIRTLPSAAWLAVASGLCSDREEIRSAPIGRWRTLPAPSVGKIPAVFLFGHRATNRMLNTR